MAQYKICSSCNETKNTIEFSKIKISKDGFRNSCKICIKEQQSKYYLYKKEELQVTNKKWRENNQDKLKINDDKFNIKNPDYKKEYYLKNKESINKRNKIRRETDDNFRLKDNIRHLIKNSITFQGYKKNTKTIQILGINNEEFKKHLESKFESWMTWENMGNPKDGKLELNKTWDIDHIIPLYTAVTYDDIIKLNYYINLQPLCSYTNRVTKRNNDIKLKIK